MMKRGGGVDGGSGNKKSIFTSQGGANAGSGGAAGGAGTSRKLKNISAFSSPYGLM